tara:strand:+ start:241270 stop:241734 length:465 start_codon:yes stop_codon:yes gene_type:complete
MKRKPATAAAAVLLMLSLAGCDAQPPASAVSILKPLQGQWVVINYWAQWCKPCIKEIPELNALDAKFDNVTVLGVNYDGAAGLELQEQLETLNVAFVTLPEDPAYLFNIDRPRVLPTTLIINPQGKLDATLVGPQTLASLVAATGQSLPVEQEK